MDYGRKMQLQRSITESLEKSRTAILRRSKISPWRAENADYQGHGGAVNLAVSPSRIERLRLYNSFRPNSHRPVTIVR